MSFQAADGLSLVGDAWGEESARPVVLLHGGGQTRHAWSGTAEGLAREGWYAIALDLRGHGDSDWHPDGRYSFEAFADDVACVCHESRTPPVLVGASLGGLASLMAIARNEESVASALVLVDVATRLESAGVERIMSFMQASPDGFASLDEAADSIAAYMPHRPRPRDPSGLAKNLRLHSDGRYRWHWDPHFVHGEDRPGAGLDPAVLDRAAESLSIPTLLVRGRMSDILSAEGAQHFLEQVPSARFVDVSDAGHMVAGDRNDVFTAAVSDFLRELP